MRKVFRLSTVPESLDILLKGQLSYLNKYYEITAISGAGNFLDRVKEREKVKTIPVHMERRISPIKDIISLVKLYILFKKEKPDLIHSITPKAGLLTMLAGYLAGVPVRIHTFTGLIFPYKRGLMQKLLIYMDKLLCLTATKIYPEGQGVKEDLIKFNITTKPLHIIGNGNVNGIDLKYFSPEQIDDKKKFNLKNNLGVTDNDFIFIFVGRLVRDKGINELVTAFKNLDEINVKLLLVGSEESDLDPLDKETLAEIDSNPNIIAVGYQNDVRPYFAISDCLVFPSYREGFPNVVIQAGAMKLPSIVTDINGSNEIVINDKNGVIIPVKNVEAITTSMKKLISNSDFYNKLKGNSRSMITTRYNQALVWEALRNEYNTLLNENG